MRIVIEIDGVELVRTGEMPDEVVPEISLGTTASGLTPPDKLLRAAAALGAESAGAAPAEIADMGAAEAMLSGGYDLGGASVDKAMDAGAGPDGPSDKAPARKTKKKK